MSTEAFNKCLVTQESTINQLKILKRNYDKTSVARRTRGYVQKRIESIDELWKSFLAVDAELQQFNCFKSSKYAEEGIFEFCDELYSDFSGDLADVMYAIEHPIPEGNIPNQPVHPQPPNPQYSNFRLPQITIPVFDGDYASWSSFSDLFTSLIHSNDNLSNVQKLHYLKSNLRGAAANLLRNTTITNDNYEIAWTALKTRFANKRALVDAQLKILTNQSIHHSENPTNIRNLIDVTNESLNALRGLEIEVDNWDPLLLFILVQKLSKETQKAWELDQQATVELSSMKDFTLFLENRFRMLETLSDRQMPMQRLSSSNNKVKSHATQVSSSSQKSCPICSGNHYIRACDTFLQMNVADRRNVAKQHRVCFNCLVQGHYITECKNRMRCQKCNKHHNTLLHQQEFTATNLSQSTTSQQSSETLPISSLTTFISTFRPQRVILATAIIHVISMSGQLVPLRALIDQGSEITLVTENAVQLLRLQKKNTNLPLSGIGHSSAGRIRHFVQLNIRSQYQSRFTLRANALVLNRITGMIPRSTCPIGKWSNIEKLTLADPSFATPGQIDILLGSDVYKHIILPGISHGADDAPVAQSTVFGWILSGSIRATPEQINESNITTLHTCIDIDNRLKSFWELEEIPSNRQVYTAEEEQCEELYRNTHRRLPNGRYEVRLPFRSSVQLGESRTSAMQRFMQIERKLNANSELRESYVQFMREYLTLGHMQLADSNSNSNKRFFLPHHAVFKETSSTTKTRVVFDASHKSNSGQSLNDCLLTGPKIQDDLSTILLRWRKYPIAFSADVEKMYRQVLVHPEDQHVQTILWRESSKEPILEYTLKTLTYGTSCAPYLAVRTLLQLAIDNENSHPEISQIIKSDFYVDDLLSGAYNKAMAINIQRQLNHVLSTAGFNLRKWVSNDSELLEDIPLQDREIKHLFTKDANNTISALGIIWDPVSDTFKFTMTLPTSDQPPTKRNVLSDISKIFDPLGWLSPIIIRAKIFMQKLWLKGVNWDEALQESTIADWKSLRSDLLKVKIININRWIGDHNNSMELHGFSDASTNAYGAAIYARIKQPDSTYITMLLTAKTRVAPLKQVSIPRLELCGAVLLAELLKKTRENLRILDCNMFAWTDSTIVLHWLRAEPRSWKTFIANRVSTIQQTIPNTCWRHVPTASNPADCASRGMETIELKSFDLWWYGPTWLKEEPSQWPNNNIGKQPEFGIDLEKHVICNVSIIQQTIAEAVSLLETFSTYRRLIRVTSLCRRFVTNCRKPLSKITGTISVEEIQNTLTFWIKVSQENSFHLDIQAINKKQTLSSKSRLQSLNPYLDELGILRVGGRLQNSSLTHNEKHPIILNNNSHLTSLIIRQHHLDTLHGGPQIVLGLIRKQYWILSARNAVRLQIHRCLTCHRYNAVSASQLMSNLPKPRITITRAFTHTGVDYAGPIELRMSKGRGNSSYKGYISIFVCMCTKAVHLEAVSDLTANAFIAAYRRFVARRGLPAHMYSDNATNFVGAVKSLRQTQDSILLKVKEQIIDNVTRNATEWHFIPPLSPHFGGLWEAGVKSLKYHLKRNVGNSKLTYEELSTVLTQIEACLNSRPLAPITSDPNDLTALTPGHFLIGDALLAPPDRVYQTDNTPLLARWQLVQKHYQTVASRWQSEYLSRLQQRPKWMSKVKNIEVGDLVLIKDSNIAPTKWPLARVIATHPGADNLVRVVTVRTKDATFKRCISKISPLPI